MRLLNRLSSERTKLYLIIVIVSLPIIASVIFAVYANNNTSENNEYYDPGSGETVSSPKNKTPERFGVSSPLITYLGFSKLLDVGTTTDQLNIIKSSIERFAISGGRSITEVSVTIDSIEQTIDDVGAISLAFDITANRSTKYSCLVEYSGLSNATVVISDDSGNQIFNSASQ